MLPKLRVLLVEDEAQAASSLAELLRIDGHQVEVAPDGPAAIRAAEAASPDVALIDIGLPGMDGIEVARHFKAQEADRRPLLIITTGRTDPESRRRSEEVGVDLHLIKPVDLLQLRTVLRRFQDFVRPGRT